MWAPPPGWGGPFVRAAMPGVVPLRPLGIGEIIDGAFAAMRAHPKVMLGIALCVALVVQVINVPLQWLLLRDVHVDPDGNDVGAAEVVSLGLTYGVQFIGQLLATGMLTLVVSRAVLGRGMSAGDAWQGARPRLPALLGLLLLTILIVAGVILAGALPGLLLAGTEVGLPLLVIGIVGGLAVAIHLYVALSLAPAALMLEKQPVLKAIARSRKLVRGSWWRILWVLVLIGLISGIVGLIGSLPFQYAASPDMFDGGSAVVTSFSGNLLLGIGTVIASTLTLPFSAGAGVLLYVDQRMRREALDLELARAAGLVADPARPAGPAG